MSACNKKTTVGGYVDHSVDRVTPGRSIPGLLYEPLTRIRGQVPGPTPDRQLRALRGTLPKLIRSSVAGEGYKVVCIHVEDNNEC